MSESRVKYVLLIVIGLGFAVSSADAQQNPRYEFSIIEEAGVPTALTTGGAKFEAPLFTFEKVLTLSSDPENEESLLFRPGEFIRDEAGYFYVADTGNGRVAVFDPAGRYLRSFGREGGGPGEFQSLELQYLQGDVIHLCDPRGWRVTRFRTDGTLIDMTSLPRRPVMFSGLYFGPDDGTLLQVLRMEERGDEFASVWERVSILNSDRDEIAAIETPHGISIAIKDGGRRSAAMYYAPQPQVCVRPGLGCMLCNGDEPVIAWYDFSGRLLRRIRLELPVRPVTRQDEANVRALEEERLVGAPPHIRESRLDLTLPENKAFWNDSQVDEAGWHWLVRYHDFDARERGLGTTCLVVSPEGEYLGQCYLPASSGRVSHGHYLTFVTDEETEERLPTVYRIVPAVEGLIYP